MPSASTASDRWIVLKFGGTSVSRRHRWDTIGRLAKKRAEENDARVLVVVSALSGVTNELTAIADGATDAAARVAGLEQRHRDFVAELELDPDAVLGERLTALRGLLSDSRALIARLDQTIATQTPAIASILANLDTTTMLLEHVSRQVAYRPLSVLRGWQPPEGEIRGDDTLFTDD